MGRTLEQPTTQVYSEEDKNGAAGESEKHENFLLQLQIKEKDEALKASKEVIDLYKEQNESLKVQFQQGQQQFQIVYSNLLKASNRATAYLIVCIALTVVMALFIVLISQ